MPSEFRPAKIEVGDVFRVKQTFYASGVPVTAGLLVRVDHVSLRVEERIYDLTIALRPIEPPGGTILWGRSHPLEQSYLDEIMERVEPPAAR